jgi:hypothetical protein
VAVTWCLWISGVFRVLRAHFDVFLQGVIRTRTLEIWKMRYQGQGHEERRARRGPAGMALAIENAAWLWAVSGYSGSYGPEEAKVARLSRF